MKNITKKLGMFVVTGMVVSGAVYPLTTQAAIQHTTILAQKEASSNTYYDVLQKADEPSQLIAYIKEHIKTATQQEIDEYMRGLFSFCDDVREVDFKQLQSVKQYLPKDVRAALPLLIKEHNKPSLKDGVANVSLNELLNRSLAYEKYLKKYSSGTGADTIKKFYQENVSFAITGGYHKGMGLPNVYADDSMMKVDKAVRQSYKQFATKNKTTKTGKVVKKYIALLNKTNGKITNRVEKFYDTIYTLTK